mgnify:CR=1 FL=1
MQDAGLTTTLFVRLNPCHAPGPWINRKKEHGALLPGKRLALSKWGALRPGFAVLLTFFH